MKIASGDFGLLSRKLNSRETFEYLIGICSIVTNYRYVSDGSSLKSKHAKKESRIWSRVMKIASTTIVKLNIFTQHLWKIIYVFKLV